MSGSFSKMVSDGGRKRSDGVRKVSYGEKMVSGRCQEHVECCQECVRMVSDSVQKEPDGFRKMSVRYQMVFGFVRWCEVIFVDTQYQLD